MTRALSGMGRAVGCAALALSAALPISARAEGQIQQVSTHMGTMTSTLRSPADVRENGDVLQFEPVQMINDLLNRDDIVLLMRHGPTDWSKLDAYDVGSTDCGNQRVMSPEGAVDIQNLAILMADNGVRPGRIVTSEWCRNQQTVDNLLKGFAMVEPAYAEGLEVETNPDMNLLLSLQGAPDVEGLRETISSWDPADDEGPLLIVTHFTNIAELTLFTIFEGEMLIVDPKRNNRVLGYLRLRSASPDVGHFADELESPLFGEQQAVDMVERYYSALNARDDELFEGVLSERWFVHGESPSRPTRDVESYLDEIDTYMAGIPDIAFEIDSLHYADDVVTVIGTLRGTHTGEMFGYAPTGRPVEFSAIAVHRISDGAIVESWQMPDRLTLIQQIK